MRHTTAELLCLPQPELIHLVAEETDLTEALHARFLESSSHIGFDELTPQWVRKCGPQILRAIGRLKEVHQWTWTEATIASMAVDRIASDLLHYLDLPETKTLACTALAIILVKGLQTGDTDEHR